MRTIRYLIRFLMLYIGMLIGTPLSIYAAEQPSVEFSVQTVLPENQFDKEHSYFDLLMEPSQKQQVEVEVWNLSDAKIQVSAEVHSAITNELGVVEYNQEEEKKDDTLPYQMSELVSCDDVITLDPGEKKPYTFTIQMPEKSFKGVLAGGITFALKEDSKKKEKKEDGFAIDNNYAYVIGMVLRENKRELKPELVLNEIAYHDEKGKEAIGINIQNIKSEFVEEMDVEARIVRKGTTGTLHEVIIEDMKIAPNSNFDFSIDLEGKPLNDGEFTLHMEAISARQDWVWEKDFNITAHKIEAKQERLYAKKRIWPWVLGTATGVVAFAISIGIYRYRKGVLAERKIKKEMHKSIW